MRANKPRPRPVEIGKPDLDAYDVEIGQARDLDAPPPPAVVCAERPFSVCEAAAVDFSVARMNKERHPEP
jgi:hypothetical protein